MDTDIPALHPPALIVTVVRHIVQVIPDVAIRAVTVPTSCPCWDQNEVTEKYEARGHFRQDQEVLYENENHFLKLFSWIFFNL